MYRKKWIDFVKLSMNLFLSFRKEFSSIYIWSSVNNSFSQEIGEYSDKHVEDKSDSFFLCSPSIEERSQRIDLSLRCSISILFILNGSSQRSFQYLFSIELRVESIFELISFSSFLFLFLSYPELTLMGSECSMDRL